MTYALGKVERLCLLLEDCYELLDSLCKDLVVQCGDTESPVPRSSPLTAMTVLVADCSAMRPLNVLLSITRDPCQSKLGDSAKDRARDLERGCQGDRRYENGRVIQ
jgi:hypothetical protein